MTAYSMEGLGLPGLFLWFVATKPRRVIHFRALLVLFSWGWMGMAVANAQANRYQVQVSGALLMNQPDAFERNVLAPLAEEGWLSQTDMPFPLLLDLNVEVPVGKLKGGLYFSYRFSTFSNSVERGFSEGASTLDSRVWSSVRMTGLRLGVDWVDFFNAQQTTGKRLFLVTNLRAGGGVQFSVLTFRADNHQVAGLSNRRQAAFAPAYDVGAELIAGLRLGVHWSLCAQAGYTVSETGRLSFDHPNGSFPGAFEANSYSWSGLSFGFSIAYSFAL